MKPNHDEHEQDRGAAAFELGDYDTAFREWLKLAQEGDATAQFRGYG